MLLSCVFLALSLGQDPNPGADLAPSFEKLRSKVGAEEATDPAVSLLREGIGAHLELLRSRRWTPTQVSLGPFDPWARPPLLEVDFTAKRVDEEASSSMELRLDTTFELPETLAGAGARPEKRYSVEAQPALEVQLERAERLALDLRPAGRHTVVVEHHWPEKVFAWVLRPLRPGGASVLFFSGMVSFEDEGRAVWDFEGQRVPHDVLAPLWRAAVSAAGESELGALLVERGEGDSWRAVVVVTAGTDIWAGGESRAIELRLDARGHVVADAEEPLSEVRVWMGTDFSTWTARRGNGSELRFTGLSPIFCTAGDQRERPPARIDDRPVALAAGRGRCGPDWTSFRLTGRRGKR